MKKEHKYDEMAEGVFCTSPKCGTVHGRTGEYHHPIKANVVGRMKDASKVQCYGCLIFAKTGMTVKEHKESRRSRPSEPDEMDE